MITISRQAWSMPECLSACPWGDLDFKDVRWSFATSPWYLSHCQNFIDMESHCWAKSKQNVSHSVTWLELDTLKTQIYTISGFSRSEFLILVHVDCCMHTICHFIYFSHKDKLLNRLVTTQKWVTAGLIQHSHGQLGKNDANNKVKLTDSNTTREE